MLRLLVNEAASTVRCALYPLEKIRKLPKPSDQKLPKTLLVHGFMGSSHMFYPMARHLLERGIPEVRFAQYPSTSFTLDQIMDHLEETVDESRDEPWNFVGHSLGAVAIRAWLKQRKSAPPLRHFIALGAPFHGTAWHSLTPPNVRAVFDPSGPWVSLLNEGPEPSELQIIRARHDQNVRPSSSASIDGVKETVLDHVGHNGLINHPSAIRAVWDALSAHPTI